MTFLQNRAATLAAALLLLGGCGGESADGASNAATAVPTIPVTITTAGGDRHVFNVEIADTVAEQQQGLMYRRDIAPNAGMLFAPYPPEGGEPKEASFWMQNTPMPLDILFIRPDGTVARIAENTIPFSTDPVRSGEPVNAVLEIPGGRSAELGISPGDTVRWQGQGGR